MATATMERTVEEIIAGWRDGDLDGPVGPVFSEGFAVQEITATGGGGWDPWSGAQTYSEMSGSYDPCKNIHYYCC